MNNYAFFQKKQDTKAQSDKQHLEELLFLAQIMWLMQAKQNQYLDARQRMHKLICYLLYKRHLRLNKQKIKKEFFWYQKKQHDDSSFHQYTL